MHDMPRLNLVNNGERQLTSTSACNESLMTLHEYTPDLVRVPYSNIAEPHLHVRCSPWWHPLCCIAASPVTSMSRFGSLVAVRNLHQVEQPVPSGNNLVPSRSPAKPTTQSVISFTTASETTHLISIQQNCQRNLDIRVNCPVHLAPCHRN